MAQPSRAAPPPRARRKPVALVGSENATPATPTIGARILARLKPLLAEGGDSRLAQLVAGKVFFVRVGSAMLALASQVLLARWMGSFEFGVYIYVWTWVLMIGALSDVGLSSAARRFIPEYTELRRLDRLRGFLSGSRWLAFTIASGIGIAGAIGVALFKPWLDHFAIIPLYLACLTIPVYGLVQIQAGIAQSYDRPNLALMPFYIWRQLALTAIIGLIWLIGVRADAVTAMIVAVATTWAVTLVQMALLNRRLKAEVPQGPQVFEPKVWFATSLPIFVVEGFYLLLTYVDILALEKFRSPHDVAVYYAGARLLAIVAFVYFAIANATAHKFSEYHVSGNRERLASFFGETVRWTFWPSLIACGLILAFGRPLLSLFGAGFEAGYDIMFILSIGLLARAAVGPAERLLNMLGERRQCAFVYAAAFTINLLLCVILIPRLGIEGAAIATSTALVAESIMFYGAARRRLGLHMFIMGGERAK